MSGLNRFRDHKTKVTGMKTITNVLLALIASLLLANLVASPSGAATKTYDAVKVTEYSACLLVSGQSNGFAYAKFLCAQYRPS